MNCKIHSAGRVLMCTLGIVFLTTSCFADNASDVRVKPLPATVTLTFDDGPNPEFTPKILAILKKNNIQATFFVMGALAKKYPQLIKEIAAEGHVVSIHTQTHPMMTKLSDKQLYAEVVQPKEIVNNILGYQPMCLRPPFGVSNERVRAYVRSKRLIPVAMGFNSFDYERPGAAKIASWVVKNAHSGMVVLLHDGYFNRQQTVDALPAMIQGIKQKGLGFSAICANPLDKNQ